jgi:hypothetical protein
MFVLLTDETNLPSDPRSKFFAYGGLIVPITNLSLLHDGIAAIRAEAGYNQTDEFKFETNARPKNVSIEKATDAKKKVIDLCISLECRFIVYVVLHAISKNTDQKDLIKWGADHVIGKFNVYLTHNDSHGIVALDRLSSSTEYKLLTEKFCLGLSLQEGEKVILDRILLFTSTCINASHISSAMDIVLGSFRYCINQPLNLEAARFMMKCITKLIWCTREGENIYAFEKGLIFRPKEVRNEKYKLEYKDLLGHINNLIAENKPNDSVKGV